ncbi:hypothetical protein GOBAR_AA05845 [Gossypium barbadense]|uniref:HMG box domain-containing protein n=1 Tax=Gossypium barbadense TaxID=3634 RepID=A0A2P5YGL5_GOSBA|nr:hypothetical protein GOBAR_AA05845 [Gossypium barbadense]
MKGGKSKSDAKSAKLSVNKKSITKAGKKSGKAAKDPNKPKRPASAFFVFMEEFREQYKKEHPKNKSVAAVGKAGGDKWKSLSEALITNCSYIIYYREVSRETERSVSTQRLSKEGITRETLPDLVTVYAEGKGPLNHESGEREKKHREAQQKREEKRPYVDKAEKRKVEYEKNMKAYNKRQEEDDE